MKTKVSIVKCKTYEQEFVNQAIKRALDLIGGLNKFIKKGDKVLLKVNLLQAAKPERAITTHPAVARAVIKLVKKAGAIPFVGDSPGFGSIHQIADVCGILKICKEENVKIINLIKKIKRTNSGGKLIKEFVLSTEIFDYDCIINLPKLKTHVLTTYTGAIKNLFGFIPGGLKKTYHIDLPDSEDFSEMLLDLYLLIKPGLNIMDAVIGMDGQGPSTGNPKEIGYILASENALALDTVATNIIGLKNVPIIYLARKRKLNGSQLKNISAVGNHAVKIKDFKRPYSVLDKIPTFMLSLARIFLTKKPVVNKKKCIKCGTCVKVCPKKAIKMKDFPEINYDKCIRCYCCHEFCPKKAITLKKGFFLNFFRERFI